MADCDRVPGRRRTPSVPSRPSRPSHYVRALLCLSMGAGCTARECTESDVLLDKTVRRFELGDCLSLNLSGKQIGSEGALGLAHALNFNDKLTSLNLWQNGIGYKGARALAEALKTNSALTSLDLGDNEIGSEGARALAEALKTNGALASLDLGANEIGDPGARALAEGLRANTALTSLDLGANQISAERFRTIEFVLSVGPEERPELLSWAADRGLADEGVATLVSMGVSRVDDLEVLRHIPMGELFAPLESARKLSVVARARIYKAINPLDVLAPAAPPPGQPSQDEL